MFQILYYPKEKPCEIIKGFKTREAAWNWVKERLHDIDWYKIESYD